MKPLDTSYCHYMGRNSLLCNRKPHFQEKGSIPKCLEHDRSTTHGKGLEVSGQNTFKDNPAFIKRFAHQGACIAKNLRTNKLV